MLIYAQINSYLPLLYGWSHNPAIANELKPISQRSFGSQFLNIESTRALGQSLSVGTLNHPTAFLVALRVRLHKGAF